jgi:hypothetical protein
MQLKYTPAGQINSENFNVLLRSQPIVNTDPRHTATLTVLRAVDLNMVNASEDILNDSSPSSESMFMTQKT